MNSGYELPHRGVLILVLGILSVMGVCAVLGPFAWIMGKGDMEKIDAGKMDPEGRGMTQAGMVCGIVATAMLMLGLLFVVGFLLILVFASAAQ